MTKKDLIGYLSDMLKDIPDDANIIVGDRRHLWEMTPTIVCGGTQWLMPYYCIREAGHKGKCYCSCKNVEFTAESPELQAQYHKEAIE